MDDIVLSGNMEFLELPDLLQLIGNNGSSGVLRFRSPLAPNPASVYIEKGNPVNAAHGSLSGIEALLSLFGWSEGTFEFSRTVIPVKHVIKKNRMEIILEGLRMVDDGKIKKVGPLNSPRTVSGVTSQSSGITTLKGPLVDYLYIADEETYHDGELIVEEGKHGSWMWVVLEGVVEIVKKTPSGPLSLGRISEGSFIGDIATFLAKEHVRGASAFARGTVQLGVIDSQRLSNEFSSLSRKFRDLLLSFDQRLKLVSGNALRLRLGQPLFAELQQGMSLFSFSESDDDKIYIIKNGDAAISRTMGKDQVQVVLANISPGDFLGHIPFLNTGLEPYNAIVLVSKNIEMEPLDPMQFQPEYDRLSDTFKNIIEHISASISITTKMAEDSFNNRF
jgi:CRP-like cAMP-binding protein